VRAHRKKMDLCGHRERRRWSAEEVARLREGVGLLGCVKWEAIRARGGFDTRTGGDLLRKWRLLEKQKQKPVGLAVTRVPQKAGRERRRWTTAEEEKLREGVNAYGEGNWELIQAKLQFERRTGNDLLRKWQSLERDMFDPDAISSEERKLHNAKLYGPADHHRITAARFSPAAATAVHRHCKEHWAPGKMLRIQGEGVEHQPITGFYGFSYTVEGSSSPAQRTDSAVLRGRELDAALRGGIAGLGELGEDVLSLAARQPCADGREPFIMGVDMLRQRGHATNKTSNFGPHQDTWGWSASKIEPSLTCVVKCSAGGGSRMRLCDGPVFTYARRAGAGALFAASAWHESLPALSCEELYKSTFFIGYRDSDGVHHEHERLPLQLEGN